MIFDVDGTIIQSNRVIFDSFQYIIKKYRGGEISDSEVIQLFGPTEEDIIDKWFRDERDVVLNDYFEYYSANHDRVYLFDGIKDVVVELKLRQVNLAVLTGKGRRSTEISLGYFDMLKYFDYIVTGTEVKEHKPNPEGMYKLLNFFNVEPEECLMIGDSTADIQVAKSSGVPIASVLWDSYDREKVLISNSDYYFHSVKELADFLLQPKN